MNWWLFKRRDPPPVESVTIDLRRAEAEVREATHKLERDRDRQAAVSEAVRAARRTVARVDRFTAAMEESFRRVEGHGHG